MPDGPPASCVVVGAGPAGLAAAWSLQRRGVRTTVLDAAATVGGRTRTIHLHGSTVNTGAAFLASFYDETLQLCRTLDLPLGTPRVHPTRAGVHRLMATPRGHVPYAPGRPLDFFRFSLVPARQRIRLLAEIARLVRGPELHVADRSTLERLDDVDARSWATERFGGEACDYLVRPAIEPFFYMRAEEVSASVARALLRHATRWSVVAPVRGMGALCDTLAARLDVRLGCRVHAVRTAGRTVHVEHSGGLDRADAVVLAVPAPDLLRIAGGTNDRTRPDVAAARFEPCIAVLLGYARPPALPAASITVGGPEAHALVGATALARGGLPGLVRDGREIVSVLAMGWRSRALLGCGDDAIVAALRAELERIGVALPNPAWQRVIAREHATVVPEPGFTRRLARLTSAPCGPMHLAGDWVAGISTVEGAVRSGMAAAEAVMRDVRQQAAA